MGQFPLTQPGFMQNNCSRTSYKTIISVMFSGIHSTVYRIIFLLTCFVLLEAEASDILFQ